MTTTSIAVFAAAALALSACSRAPDPAQARAAIRAADSAFAAATKARGADGWMEYVADSGVQVTPGRNVVGRAAIREYVAPLNDTARTLTWMPTSSEASEDGTLGYTIGRWERTFRTKDTTLVSRGSYVTIWRKQADGSWKFVVDVGETDPPPAQPAPSSKKR